MKPIFVYASDLHLADGSWTSRPAIYGDAYYSLEQIIHHCVQLRLPLVLAGDILDVKRNLARPVQQLCAAMSEMQAAGLPVYYTQGQHELDRNVTWMSVHAWPQHIHNKTIEIGGVKLYGLDWLPRGDIQKAFAEVPPDTDILICHQVWKDFMKNIGRPECCLNDVHHVQYVMSGDFHVTTTAESTNAQGQPVKMFSTGSTCMQDISESPEKWFYVVSADVAARKFEFDLQPLITRRLRTYTVDSQDLLDKLCAGGFAADIAAMQAERGRLPPDLQKPLVRVKFDKRLPDAYLRISTAVGEAAHLFCDALVDKTKGEEATNRAVTKNDLTTALEDLLKDSPEALKIANALLCADNPGQEIEQQFAKFQAGENAHAVDAT